MKSTIVKGISLLLSFGFFFSSSAQDPEAALSALNKKLPPEKIYIHYDKDNYRSGETIWFKAYVYSNGLPSMQSHNLYLQLVNAAGDVVEKKIYPVAGATATGSIQIPDSLPAGSYYVRATTPSMLNQGEDFVYRKSMPIYDPVSRPKAVQAKSPLSLQFFPESGNLIDGIITVVAFKTTDKWGYPSSVSGVIKSNTGTVMTSFKAGSDGIGKVQFKPTAGQQYFAEVDMDGRKYTYPLPAVQAGGVNLKVQDEKDGKVFQITRGEVQKDKFPSVSLLVQLNNEVVYRNVIPFDDYLSVKGRLLTQGLPPGVLHFTLFDAAGNPVAERLSFVHNREYMLTPELSVQESSFLPGGRTMVQLKFPQGIKGVFSVSVTDASATELPDRENIYSRLLLTGDLKSHVYNPARYFENDQDSTKRALDNLLLTQTWSRFNWGQLLKNELPAARFRDNYLRSITGVVTDEKTGDRIYGGILNLFLEGEDSASQNYNIAVNNAGKYVLDSVLFYGAGKIRYTYTEGKKPPKVNITVERTKMDSIAAVIPKSWSDIRLMTPGRDVVMNSWTPRPYLPKSEVAEETGEPKTEKDTEKSSEPKHAKDASNQKYAEGVWRNNGRVIYEETMKVNGSMSALEYILLNISNVKVQGNRLVNTKNMSIATGQHWDVGVFLDEGNVSQGQAQTVQMRDVGMIKFYESGFVGVGTQFGGGAVAIYRKKDSAKKPLAGELPFVPYTGYSMYKDFSKVYAAMPKPTTSTLLYWNPSVFVDSANNTITVGFDNNASAKKFKIVVEGFDASGKLMYFEKIIE